MSEITIAAPEHIKASINETQFFGSLKHLFAGSFSMLGELMQNGRRAGATAIRVTFDPAKRSLTFNDDGTGIADFQSLVILAQSGWDERTVDTENPFGMGLFSVLFAAERITFRSRGRRLALSLPAVIERHELLVEPDDSAPERGTTIELNGLKPELLEIDVYKHSRMPDGDKATITKLYDELTRRAAGFAIPVYLNGVELPRPNAQANLAGEHTEIGFVSIRGVHFDLGHEIDSVGTRTSKRLYLQGLPIHEGVFHERAHPNVLVHLDTKAFIPQMPDRARLYDADKAEKRIAECLQAVVRRFLEARKRSLAPAEFALKHWHDCDNHGMLHLMNDVPYLPTDWLYEPVGIFENRDAARDASRPPHWTHQLANQSLVSRAEVECGLAKIWRRAPLCPSEDVFATLILKIMEREKIATLHRNLPHEHWIHQCTPDAMEFLYEFDVGAVRGEADAGWFNWPDERVKIALVDSMSVTVRGDLGEGSARKSTETTYTIDNDWVILPQDLTRSYDDCVDASSNPSGYVCYLIGQNGHHGGVTHPLDALSEWTDENDSYREEWRQDAQVTWDATVAGLKGHSLATIVQSALNNSDVTASECHLPQMAIVRVVRRQLGDGSLSKPVMRTVDLTDDEFWQLVATHLDSAPDDTPYDRLRTAFERAVNPGQDVAIDA